MTAFLWITAAALGADCDVSALKAALNEASPVVVPERFVALAECDAGAAKAAAQGALDKTLAGDEANEAVKTALAVGAEAEVSAWLDKLEPDLRSKTIQWLGQQCKAEPAVEKFFVNSTETKGEDFWKERWYRGLADCKTPDIQALLTTAMGSKEVGRDSRDRSAFFGLLEVYAKNLGAASHPTLTELATEITDAAEVRLVVSAFSNSASVGSKTGMDQPAAKKAISAINALGPTLPADAVDAGRDTLRALGADDDANAFVVHRWSDRFDGGYTYLAAATEIVTCKNGKTQAYLHLGELHESGRAWPDAIEAGLKSTLESGWSLDHAAKCKGTGETTVAMTREPVTSGDSSFFDTQRETFATTSKGSDKAEEVDAATLSL